MDFVTLFKDATVAGISLLVFVLGLVQFIKGFGLEGNTVRLVSLFIGLIFGLGYQLSNAIPTDFGGWFAAVVFGLALGLASSGVFDVLNKAE